MAITGDFLVATDTRGWTTADKDDGILNDESFEVFLEAVAPGKLAEAEQEVGKSKVRKGLWIAENVPGPSEERPLRTDHHAPPAPRAWLVGPE
jgi:hypothetical protein